MVDHNSYINIYDSSLKREKAVLPHQVEVYPSPCFESTALSTGEYDQSSKSPYTFVLASCILAAWSAAFKA